MLLKQLVSALLVILVFISPTRFATSEVNNEKQLVQKSLIVAGTTWEYD